MLLWMTGHATTLRDTRYDWIDVWCRAGLC